MTERDASASAALPRSGRLLIFGGARVQTLEEYSEATDTWKLSARMPGPRIRALAVACAQAIGD